MESFVKEQKRSKIEERTDMAFWPDVLDLPQKRSRFDGTIDDETIATRYGGASLKHPRVYLLEELNRGSEGIDRNFEALLARFWPKRTPLDDLSRRLLKQSAIRFAARLLGERWDQTREFSSGFGNSVPWHVAMEAKEVPVYQLEKALDLVAKADEQGLYNDH